jgi:hypothetical protein
MKTATWFIMFLPATLLGLSIICEDEPAANELLGWLSLLAAIFCLGWAFCIRRQYRVLAWFCGAVGLLYVGAMVLAGFVPAKTGRKASAPVAVPNQRPGVDAGWPLLFAGSHSWSRATQAGRWPATISALTC